MVARRRSAVFMVGAERAAREREVSVSEKCVRFVPGEPAHAATPVVDEW